jgi:pyruvate/2-oxoglutarate dehydrogenase complex dihydrolipoamide acyltransferase (E2) component
MSESRYTEVLDKSEHLDDNPVAVHLPQTGTENAATFIEWLVQVGDQVVTGDKLATAETDKAVVEIESPASGRIGALLVKPQEEITTDTVLTTISPSAGGDLHAAQSAPAYPSATSQAVEIERRSDDQYQARAVTPQMRRAAENLLWVVQNTARASTTVEVDFEAVATVRAALADEFRERHGLPLTYLPFIAAATLRALQRYPEIAAQIESATNTLRVPTHTHLGIAVAREAGLIVPVIREAEKLTFIGLAQQIGTSVDRVRAGIHGASEVTGGTFTISNPGALGSYLSAPVMNRGETSILCVDAVEMRAAVVDSDIVARRRAFFTLAFDHRIVDGMLALKFLADVKAQLQSCDPSWIAQEKTGGVA